MERKCIYCGATENLSESDIIPDALTNARILNKNVCKIEHNNKFSDMFESKVIKALAFITNELDIKSSKAHNFASYEATINIEGIEYETSISGDYNIFNGRVLKSADKTQMISSYDKLIKITGDERNVDTLDVNQLDFEKTVQISSEIFYEQSMYRMISKIAFEWYCAKNNVIGYHQEFDNIISFITTGIGNNPVSIIQQAELYDMLSKELNLGSHTLFAFEASNGEIDVVVFLFGLMMYRVVVSKTKPIFCDNNFLFTELRTDSQRHEIVHESYTIARNHFFNSLNPGKFKTIKKVPGACFVIPKDPKTMINITLYTFVFNAIKFFDKIRDDTNKPNKNLNDIFFKQIKEILQSSTLHKKSIKRFVKEHFPEGHTPIKLNPHGSNKKETMLFYVVYLVGLSGIDELNENIFQHLLREKLPFPDMDNIIITDESEQQLKSQIMETDNYSDILEKGALIIEHWDN